MRIYTTIFFIILVYILLYFYRLNQDPINITEYIPEIFPEIVNQLDQKTTELLPSPQAELLSGILLGEKKSLPGWFKVALRDTSTLHIVVVSGQNLTFLAGFTMGLAGLFHKRMAIMLSLLAIIFYVLLTGAQVPVLRAASMSLLAFLASVLGRQRDSVWILLISAALLLLINPNWLTDLSFQLSFLASIGVITVAPILFNLIKHWPSFIAEDLSITLGAQLMVIPIIAQSFHQFSVIGIITNVLVGWTIPLIMILGGVMLIFAVIFTPIAQLISLVVNGLLTYFVDIVTFSASLPFAWEYVGEKSWIFWLGYYVFLAGVLSYTHAKNSTGTRHKTGS